MDPVKGVFYPKIVLFAGFLLASVSGLCLTLFGFLNSVFHRDKKTEGLCSQKSNQSNPKCNEQKAESEVAYSGISRHGGAGYNTFGSEYLDYSSTGFQESNQTDSNHTEPAAEAKLMYSEIFGSRDPGRDCLDAPESETPEYEFKFRFPTYEEISRLDKENSESLSLDSTAPPTNTNKYKFLSGKCFSHFLEEPEAVSFTVKEFYAVSTNHSIESSESPESDSMQQNSLEETVHEKISETPVSVVSEKLEAWTSAESSHCRREQLEELGNVFLVEDKFHSEEEDIASDSDLDSVDSSLAKSHLVSLSKDLFLSEKDFEGPHEGRDAGLNGEDLDLEDMDSHNLNTGFGPEDFEGESDILEELQKLEEESDMQDSITLKSRKFCKDVFHSESCSRERVFGVKEGRQMGEKPNLNSSSEWDSEDPNGLETLWEHQDLIEQLRMELKKVRATGLPTILEDSECPKIIEELKPWKIDEKFQHGDRMGELHKFFKSYRERMRKFDILNYQKMYAIGFLGSKDPLQSFPSYKSSAPAITSILSQNIWLRKHKKSESDPMVKFIRDLHNDLEVVYVGQLCLSWEILHWQYEKALELWESDPYGLHPYNEVAGEFQQFQVLLQRFIENEHFQGPRVENYVKNRCLMRNLLQVPVIRGDRKKERKGRDDGAITIDIVIEILEESMRIIWKFIRADKDASSRNLSRRDTDQVELQDTADSVLLMKVRTDLQKKEKKFRDMLKSGSCILKKFQKHQEDGIDHHFFFSQVDMKLVSRVLNMSRITTDQLGWCRCKLSQISFVNRKMRIEPTFLLFPC